MARGSRRKTPTNAATTQTSLDTAETRAPKKRRSNAEIKAELLAKLDAVTTREKLEAVASNKPLVAAIKSMKRLKPWLSEEIYGQVEAEIQLRIDNEAGDDDNGSDDDDGDAS